MGTCFHCGADTNLNVDGQPVCLECAARIRAGLPPKKPPASERMLSTEERSHIVTTLYNDVIHNQLRVSETKDDAASHRAALAALSRAVKRYTDFALNGTIPDNLSHSKSA